MSKFYLFCGLMVFTLSSCKEFTHNEKAERRAEQESEEIIFMFQSIFEEYQATLEDKKLLEEENTELGFKHFLLRKQYTKLRKQSKNKYDNLIGLKEQILTIKSLTENEELKDILTNMLTLIEEMLEDDVEEESSEEEEAIEVVESAEITVAVEGAEVSAEVTVESESATEVTVEIGTDEDSSVSGQEATEEGSSSVSAEERYNQIVSAVNDYADSDIGQAEEASSAEDTATGQEDSSSSAEEGGSDSSSAEDGSEDSTASSAEEGTTAEDSSASFTEEGTAEEGDISVLGAEDQAPAGSDDSTVVIKLVEESGDETPSQ